jgi:hypothetical protein
VNSLSWREEELAFANLSRVESITWLARLAAALTVAARDTYEVGGDGILDNKRMRRINELIHRVIYQILHRLNNEYGYPNNAFFRLLESELEEMGIGIVIIKRLM